MTPITIRIGTNYIASFTASPVNAKRFLKLITGFLLKLHASKEPLDYQI